MAETEIHVRRRWFGPKAVIGELFFDNEQRRQCYTLEDVERAVKVEHETSIPVGRYQVIIDHSQRFGRLMPRLLGVPGFEGVRIHSGNTDKDTDGCILLGGALVNADFIGESRAAFTEFFGRLELANRLGKVFVSIADEPAPTGIPT